MKKKLLALGLLSLSAITLCSCHHVMSHEKFIVPTTFDENKQYTISFWAKNDSDQRQVDVYKKAISEFNEYYPNITIELRNFTSYPDIYREVLVNLNTDTAPNVCISYPDNVATYLESENSVVALGDLMKDSNYGFNGSLLKFKPIGEDGIVDSFLHEGIINDEYYTIPYMRSTEALYINKTYVERLGFEVPSVPSWDWLWEVAAKAVEEREGGTSVTSKTDPSKDFKPLIYKSSDNWLIQYAAQANIKYTTKDSDILLFNDDTTKFLLDLKDKCKNKKYYEVFSNTSHYPGDLINVWDAIFGIDSTAGSSWIGFDSPQGASSLGYESFETELTVIPQVDINNPKMISQGPSICLFNKADSGVVMASWLFAQYLLSDSIQMAYQKTEGYLPVTKSVLNGEEFKNYLNSDEIYSGCKKAKELLLNNLDKTFITPVFNGSADVRSAAGYLINAVSTATNAFQTESAIKDKLYPAAIKNYDLTELYNKTNFDSETEEEKPKEEINSKDMKVWKYILIVGLISVWVGLIAYFIYSFIKKKKQE